MGDESKNQEPLENDLFGTHGVLLSDEIEYYARNYSLIVPFDPNKLKPASYRLTVGDEYVLGGKTKKLSEEPGKNEIIIPPFQVAVIKTREILKLPRFMIARWNIRVTKAYDGLLWVGGVQVDPGYRGNLFCPIYNLSKNDVVLRFGESMATIDFVKTTPFKDGCLKYPYPPPHPKISDWKPERLISALFTVVGERIDKIEKDVYRLINVIFIVFAIVFAAISIIATSNSSMSFSIWVLVGVILSILALSIAIYTRIETKSKDYAESVDLESRVKNLEFFDILVIIVLCELTVVMVLLTIWGKIQW